MQNCGIQRYRPVIPERIYARGGRTVLTLRWRFLQPGYTRFRLSRRTPSSCAMCLGTTMLNSQPHGADQITIRLTDVPRFDLHSAQALICGGCHDIEEIVLKILEITSIGGIWSLCGKCLSELPKGFQIA
jgi:hypothetical protein